MGKILWRREWQPTAVVLPGESHGQSTLAGYSPWGHKELDTTERLTLGDTGGQRSLECCREAWHSWGLRVRHDLATEQQQQIMTSWSPDFGPQLSSLCYWKEKERFSLQKQSRVWLATLSCSLLAPGQRKNEQTTAHGSNLADSPFGEGFIGC